MRHPSPTLSHSLETYLISFNAPGYTPSQRTITIEHIAQSEWYKKNLSDMRIAHFFETLKELAEQGHVPNRKELSHLIIQSRHKNR